MCWLVVSLPIIAFIFGKVCGMQLLASVLVGCVSADVPTIVDAQRGRELFIPGSSEPWLISCTTNNDYSPDPSITWLHNGNSIGTTSPWEKSPIPPNLNDFVSFGELLEIAFDRNVDVSGEYTCSVHNGLGTDSATFLLEPIGMFPILCTGTTNMQH